MCPKCKNSCTTVIEVAYNPKEKEFYRKRRCSKCGHVYFTVEFEVVNNRRFQRDWFLYHKKKNRFS